jgi:hypothetical protein
MREEEVGWSPRPRVRQGTGAGPVVLMRSIRSRVSSSRGTMRSVSNLPGADTLLLQRAWGLLGQDKKCTKVYEP